MIELMKETWERKKGTNPVKKKGPTLLRKKGTNPVKKKRDQPC